MSIHEYIATQALNSESTRRCSRCFNEIIVPFDRLYETALTLIPIDGTLFYGKVFLLCHRSFLAAASLIAQAQPDDAAPLSRRALEMARAALAFKADPMNADRWLAYEQREARWAARGANQKPRGPVNTQFHNVAGPIWDELGTLIGALSDAHVHFTPEFFGVQAWQVTESGQMAELFHSYFVEDTRMLDLAFFGLIAHHSTVLKALDVCYGHAFTTDPGWLEQFRAVSRTAAQLMGNPTSE